MGRYILVFELFLSSIHAEWIQKADFPGILLKDANAISFGDKGFIFGGIEWNGNFNNNVWMYNLSENIWVQKSNLPIALNDSYIYNMPKFFNNSSYIYSMRNNNIYRYNYNEDIWDLINSSYPGVYEAMMPQTIFSTNNYLYAGYGWYDCGTPYYPSSCEQEELFRYNYSLNSWEEIASIEIFEFGNGNHFTFDGQNTLIWNGWHNQLDSTKIYKYQYQTNTIELISTLPYSLNGYLGYSRIFYHQNNLHILGGMEIDGDLVGDTSHYVFSFVDSSWYQRVSLQSTNFDYPGRANPVSFIIENNILCGLGMGSGDYYNNYDLHNDFWQLNLDNLVGDLNFDGEVSISDAILIIMDIIGNSDLLEEQLIIADIDHNQIINIFDAVLIIDIINN